MLNVKKKRLFFKNVHNPKISRMLPGKLHFWSVLVVKCIELWKREQQTRMRLLRVSDTFSLKAVEIGVQMKLLLLLLLATVHDAVKPFSQSPQNQNLCPLLNLLSCQFENVHDLMYISS